MNYSHCPFFGEEGRCLDGSYFSDYLDTKRLGFLQASFFIFF